MCSTIRREHDIDVKKHLIAWPSQCDIAWTPAYTLHRGEYRRGKSSQWLAQIQYRLCRLSAQPFYVTELGSYFSCARSAGRGAWHGADWAHIFFRFVIYALWQYNAHIVYMPATIVCARNNFYFFRIAYLLFACLCTIRGGTHNGSNWFGRTFIVRFGVRACAFVMLECVNGGEQCNLLCWRFRVAANPWLQSLTDVSPSEPSDSF